MRDKANNVLQKIVDFLASGYFLAIVIGFFVLNALWVAFSFRYPMIYDEGTHLSVIQAYSTQFSPYLTELFPAIPFHYSGYHYLMSFPYRFIELITDNLAVQVIFLRIINILMVAVGLFVFAQLLRKIRINQRYINVGLVVFTLLPIVPLVAATINYDNMLFMLMPIYMLICTNIIMSRNIDWRDYALLIILGSLASLVKYTFLPIFAVSVIYVAIVVFRCHRNKFAPALVLSFKKSFLRWKIVGGVGIIIFAGLFTLEYIQNVVQFGSPQPSCFDVVEHEDCKNSSIIQRNVEARNSADQRSAALLTDYTLTWFTNMSKTTNFSGNSTLDGGVVFKKPLPFMDLLVFLGVILGIGVLVYAWRSLPKNSGWYFLFTMTVALFIVIFIVNVRSYYIHHAAFANQPRYLLHVIPILLTMIAVAVGYVLRNLRWLKVASFVGLLVIFTQGGGLITHMLRSDASWYWQEPVIIEANDTFKDVVSPLVKE